MYLTIRFFVCNQYPVMYPGCFIIVCNVNSVNGPSVRSLIPQHFCVLETPSWLISYKISYFPWKKFIWGHVLLNFSSFGQTNYVCGCVVYRQFWPIVLVQPMPALIDRPCFIFDFHLNLSCHIILYFIVFQLIHFPCRYLIIIDVYYLLCDQITYRTFHSQILGSFVWQVLVISVYHTNLPTKKKSHIVESCYFHFLNIFVDFLFFKISISFSS